MPYDPHREDYLRLSLRFAHTLDNQTPDAAEHAFANFGRRFARERDSLPQTDSDRAFRLVADAAVLIDYKLPFTPPEQADDIAVRGQKLLSEALSLDPNSPDANRMLAASEQPSFDAFYSYLKVRVDEVRSYCEKQRSLMVQDENSQRTSLAMNITMRPYMRWIASMASNAVICGRNREALRLWAKAIRADPADEAGVRFTVALALTKLEDEQGLDKLVHDCRPLPTSRDGLDPWTLLCRAALAYKRYDLSAATAALKVLISNYPHACAALIRQRELPDGVFSRLATPSMSEDELIVAVSECTVLLQEGEEENGRGPFGLWVADQAAKLASPWELDEVKEAQRQVDEFLAHEREEDQSGNDEGGSRK